ncbi:hypothetical protein V1525DRAFT_407797 [Lipomyces kononenkoae]|uniref:Uncharacterized protein n=1 Tax=Lipomyces kononenkoae TaxID=34357 RepID=A0ACC3SX27_LIPKO
MALSRSFDRNVHVFDPQRPEEPLGGLYLNPSVTKGKFLRMLAVFIHPNGHYKVWREGAEAALNSSAEPLEPGRYYIIRDSPDVAITVSHEQCITRAYSRTVSRRDRHFREQVRARDGKCVITGNSNPAAHRGYWSGFEAAHIFPSSHEELFKALDFPRHITLKAGCSDSGINSCQNGLLMQSNVHQQFDSFGFGIDPDDSYKITFFMEDAFGLDGRILDPACRNPEDERKVW